MKDLQNYSKKKKKKEPITKREKSVTDVNKSTKQETGYGLFQSHQALINYIDKL